MTEMQMGVELMGYGLLGTFAVLLIFMASIKLLTVLFPHRDGEDEK